MPKIDSREVLWDSLSALMLEHWGGENLTKLGRDAAKSSPAQASRMKSKTNSTGIEVIDRLADYFGVEAWQLLVPGFKAIRPPRLATEQTSAEAFSPELVARLATLDAAGLHRLENVMRAHLEMPLIEKSTGFQKSTGSQNPAETSTGQTSVERRDPSRQRRRA